MRFLCLSAVVALAFVSCKKTDTKTVIFSGVSQEYVVEEGSEKAYINTSNLTTFEQGDRVKLFNLATTPKKSEMADYYAMETGGTVHFQLDGPAMATTKKNAFYAFYPGENVTSATLTTNNKAVFKLDAEQEYRDVDGEPNVSSKDLYMAAKEAEVQNLGDVIFKFKNIMGVLQLKYYTQETEVTLKSLTIEDKHFHLTGDVELCVPNIDTDGLVDLCNAYDPANPEATADQIAQIKRDFGYSVRNAGYSVTLDFGDEGYTLSQDADNPSRFLIALRPLALAHGYKVIAETMNGSKVTIVDSNTNKKMIPNLVKGNTKKNLDPYFNVY